MAPKNQALSRQPSKEEQEREASSDEEVNSESDSGETEEEGSSDEETPVSTKPFKPQTLVDKFQSKSAGSDSDSDDESEGSPPPDYKVEPIRKPSPPPAKRANQEVSRSSKKLKTGEKDEKKSSNSTPGGLITRLWSDEDEIAVLNGMIDFRKMKGHVNNSEEIYNFIKGKLQGDFNKEQLRTKIGRMKKRFQNASKKGENGSDPVFSKPHEDLMFELSKKIWGDSAANGSVAAKNGNAKKETVKNGNGNGKKETVKAETEEKASLNGAEEKDFWSKYPYLSSSFLNMKGNLPSSISEASKNLLKENLSSIGDSKAKELNQKWRQLFIEEAEVNHKMLALMAEQTKLGLNHMNDN